MISSLHRPTLATVHLEAIRGNLKAVQTHIPQGTKTYAVVKANAYGHGAVAVAKAIEQQVDAYCVSNLDEAIELREAGIAKEILILGIILADQLALAISYNLVVTAASLEWLDCLRNQAVDVRGLHVHVKVDSGMGRIGVRTLTEANQLIAGLKELGASVDGIFTHFATADEAKTDKFNQQLAFFTDLVDALNDKPALVHASNSATSLWHSDSIFNAVRLGIVIYGLNPSGRDLALPYSLTAALSLESALVHVKCIEAGATVGYGATYEALETQFVGTIPIGYADGWTRDMQNFKVLIDGQFCPVIGRVSMDQLTVRLPKTYPIGTKVTLIGRNGKHEITATEVAEKRGTINYEVTCLLSDRVPRFYRD
ncbi:alanine racemase [Streptococcus iniae]|uniref:alanine racemase n=1 Tax=Streptococcus iniae TaxID=1346 RepID=UPI0008D8DC79|nr:alanine racemase [Streptococcus iniae]OHX26914.1 alanine racemase [Streptococcus iniae]RLV27150.1 alanine racemase [Streptococcus iniae]